MNILAIGNSYTVDATHYLYKIAREQGVELDIYTLYIGGCSLESTQQTLRITRWNTDYSTTESIPLYTSRSRRQYSAAAGTL